MKKEQPKVSFAVQIWGLIFLVIIVTLVTVPMTYAVQACWNFGAQNWLDALGANTAEVNFSTVYWTVLLPLLWGTSYNLSRHYE